MHPAAAPRSSLRLLPLLALLATGCTREAAPRQSGPQPLGPAGAPASVFPAPARPVADIVTDTWSDEASRDDAGEAEQVMRLLEIGPTMTVADIGAGSGYYTVRLSPRVGASGRVIAQDIVPRYLERLDARVREAGLPNATLALGEPHDPRLRRASVDRALLVHMYHEVEQPYAFLYNLRPALRPGARVGVVDLDRPTNRHGTPPALLRCEFAATGYREVAFHPLASGSGYLAVFEATDDQPPTPETIRACPAR
ncbi:MAG: class I SAM-dependent methyltransferase [Gemmatimonadota bacterium]|nr:class I SAM-dependent methyltransferase [Gemmatimonadota bacterium]